MPNFCDLFTITHVVWISVHTGRWKLLEVHTGHQHKKYVVSRTNYFQATFFCYCVYHLSIHFPDSCKYLILLSVCIFWNVYKSYSFVNTFILCKWCRNLSLQKVSFGFDNSERETVWECLKLSCIYVLHEWLMYLIAWKGFVQKYNFVIKKQERKYFKKSYLNVL